MYTQPPVIATKLHPPPRRPELLHRPRLVDFLHGHIDHKLIVISAPAGYGKSSLLVDFAHESDVPICWYALDQYDADPRIFLDHLIASIRLQFPGFGQRTQAALRNSGDVRSNLYPLAAVMANELYEIADFFVVVLDDFHQLDAVEPINQFLSLLIRYSDENFHLVIASRTLTAIPDQALMVARGQMIGLSVEELKFTPDEIQALVKQNFDLDMPYDRAAELAQHSDGWITGILLTGHQATWQRLLAGVAQLSEASSSVYDYLAEQVLDLQPPELRQFMMESSVLEEMTVELCNRLLDRKDSAQILQRIVRRNLFTTPAGDGAYSYHHLLQDFLRQRLRQQMPDRCRALHLRAAELYTQLGERERAIDAYLAPGMYENAATAIEEAEQVLFEAGRWDTLVRWLDTLPQSILLARPRLMALRGRIHVERGEIEPALQLYERSLRQLRQQGDVAQAIRVQLRQAFALSQHGHYKEALTSVHEALPLVDELESSSEREALEGGLRDCQGLCHYYLGRPAEAVHYLDTAVRLFEQARDDYGAASAHHNLGITHRAMGQMTLAMEHYRQALGFWQRLDNEAWLANTLNGLAIVYYLQGEWEEAERLYLQALDHAQQGGLMQTEGYILAGLGDLQRDRGEHVLALKTYTRSHKLAEQTKSTFLSAYVAQAQGETLRLQHEHEQAEARLTTALRWAEKAHSDYVVGLCRLTQGALAADRGQFRQALDYLDTARSLLAGGGYRHEQARVELFQAHVFSLVGDGARALAHLSEAVQLVDQLGYHHLFAVDGRRMHVLLRLGSETGLFSGRLAETLAQMNYAPAASTPLVSQPEPETAAQLRIFAFGRASIMRGDQELIPQREQVKELFFYLLAQYPRPVRKEEVMEQLWEGYSQPRADGALRVTLYRLRRAICPVVSEQGWLTLKLPENVWCDIWQFEEAIRRAQEAAGSLQEQADHYERALELHQGAYLDQVESLWAMAERERLQREHRAALLALARVRLTQRDYHAAAELFQRVVEMEPYHEDAWRGLMYAQAQSGNRAAAMEAFQQIRGLLRDDLGVDPSPQTQDVYQHILEMS